MQDDITTIQGDRHDQSSLVDIIERHQPMDVDNLAFQSFVPTSLSQPVLTGAVTGLGVTRLLEAIRMARPEARRAWGYAGDYVEAMWRMLQCDTPADFVIGIGITHSVREFYEIAFGYVGLNYCDYIGEDRQLYHPAEVDLLISDPTKAHRTLGWQPSVGFEELIHSMVDADLERVGQDLYRDPRANSKVNRTLTKMT